MKDCISVYLYDQPIEFQITYYSPGSPATHWEPEEPEEIQWVAVDPAIQALITYFGLGEDLEHLIRVQAKQDSADKQEELDLLYGDGD